MIKQLLTMSMILLSHLTLFAHPHNQHKVPTQKIVALAHDTIAEYVEHTNKLLRKTHLGDDERFARVAEYTLNNNDILAHALQVVTTSDDEYEAHPIKQYADSVYRYAFMKCNTIPAVPSDSHTLSHKRKHRRYNLRNKSESKKISPRTLSDLFAFTGNHGTLSW